MKYAKGNFTKREITIQQYAKLFRCSEQKVTKNIRMEQLGYLPFVLQVKKFSRFCVLVVPGNIEQRIELLKKGKI